MSHPGFRITCEDLESGETGIRVIGLGDYILERAAETQATQGET